MIVALALREVQTRSQRPQQCPVCHCPRLYSHGRPHPKRVRDPHVKQVEIQRLRCKRCGDTFTAYPQGVGQAQQTDRLRGMVALLWTLGLPLRGVEIALSLFGIPLDHSTVWLDVRDESRKLRKKAGGVRSKIVAIDETFLRLKGKTTCLGIVVDAGGKVLALEVLGKPDKERYLAWLKGWAEEFGAEIIVSDDSVNYRGPVEELGLKQQLCLVHFRRSVARRLRGLQKGEVYQGAIDIIREVVKDLPRDGPEKLWPLTVKGKWPEKLRLTALYVLENWRKITLFQEKAGVPSNTNKLEQAIGWSKVRYRSCRGMKSVEGIFNLVTLTQHLYTGNQGFQVAA